MNPEQKRKMIITVKNFHEQTFKFDFDPEKSVKELKEKIFTRFGGEYIVEKQQLIYAGVMLQDERSVATYNVDERKFIVVILKRDDGVRKTEEPATSAKKGTKANSEPKLRQKKTETAPASVQASADSTVLMGDEYNQMVQSIIQMGYTGGLAQAALAASFYNPDRALEYLLSVIPVDRELTTASSSAGQRSANEGSCGEDALGFLRNQPQFLQMQEFIHQNPELLADVIHQIKQSNPALYQLISQNQRAFFNMLHETHESDNNSSTHSSTTASGEAVRRAAGEAITAAQPTASTSSGASRYGESEPTTIQMTAQDRGAISRLMVMGFPEHLVLEAYSASERDENLAAYLLISSKDD